MADLAYTLLPYNNLLSHDSGSILTLRDGHEFDELELQAHIRSGDYFALLATILDEISQDLLDVNRHDCLELQRIVDRLLYMQKHYEIRKKTGSQSKPPAAS